MIKTATAPYDVVEHLRTREEMAAYLEPSIEGADGDAAFVAKALSGERVPRFETVLRVVGALGLKLRAEAALDADHGWTRRGGAPLTRPPPCADRGGLRAELHTPSPAVGTGGGPEWRPRPAGGSVSDRYPNGPRPLAGSGRRSRLGRGRRQRLTDALTGGERSHRRSTMGKPIERLCGAQCSEEPFGSDFQGTRAVQVIEVENVRTQLFL